MPNISDDFSVEVGIMRSLKIIALIYFANISTSSFYTNFYKNYLVI